MVQHRQKEREGISYPDYVRRLATASPMYTALHNFLQDKTHSSQSPVKATVAVIPPTSLDKSSSSLRFKECSGTVELSEELELSKSTEGTCRLFIVENVCAQTITLLGEHFKIDPQFFADHVSNEPWYRIENVAERLPPLPSSQKLHAFLQLRYIETRTLWSIGTMSDDADCGEGGVEPVHSERVNAPDLEAAPDSTSDTRSYMLPDRITTRIPRKAGKLIPRVRKDKEFEPLLCTRQAVTVWFEKVDAGMKGWNGIVLLDPPFQLPGGDQYCMPTGYRSFARRPSLLDNSDDLTLPTSNREAFARQLKQRYMHVPELLEVARQDSFLFLTDLYRLIASNWVVINEYVNRELATIEYILEKEEPGFQELEIFLKDLYIYRRRLVKYHELITEAKDHCNKRGQLSWARDLTSGLAIEYASETEGDFTYLQGKTQGTTQRIEKNISLLASLVPIEAGKQSLVDSHGIAKLTLLAIIFVPFATIASILGMEGEFSPSGKYFWVFWIVALLLSGVIFGISALDGGFASKVLVSVLMRCPLMSRIRKM